MWITTRWLIFGFLCLGLVACSGVGGLQGGRDAGRLQAVDCPALWVSPGLPMQCFHFSFISTELGEVVLPVTILGEVDSEHEAVIYLPGGPGDGAWQDAEGLASWLQWWEEVDAGRPLVLYDPRGTGAASPKPHCPQLAALAKSEVEGIESLAALTNEAISECAADADVALAGFSTAHNRDDLERLATTLQRELGYEGFHLYGLSYGTRLGLELMRVAPPWLRSAVLDGLYPPQIDHLDELAELMESLFSRFDRLCGQTARCNDGMPSDGLLSLAARLQEAPLERHLEFYDGSVLTTRVSGLGLYALLQSESYSGMLFPFVPMMLEDFLAGDQSALDPLIWLWYEAQKLDSVNRLVLIATECQDNKHFPSERWRTMRGQFPHLQLFLEAEIDEGLCHRIGASPGSTGKPVVSDVPALLLSGELDVATPPAWGALAASSLSQARHITAQTPGHGVSLIEPCVAELMREFWDSGTLRSRPCAQEPLRFEVDEMDWALLRRQLAEMHEVVVD